MTTITAPKTGQTRRRDIRTATLAGLVGVTVGATLAVLVPRLTTDDARGAEAPSATLVRQQAAAPGLYGSSLQQQLPHSAALWLASRASSYRVGGSTYDQQVPYAARHGASVSWTQQSSTYRQQVPAFE
jgi:hypothetical protein